VTRRLVASIDYLKRLGIVSHGCKYPIAEANLSSQEIPTSYVPFGHYFNRRQLGETIDARRSIWLWLKILPAIPTVVRSFTRLSSVIEVGTGRKPGLRSHPVIHLRKSEIVKHGSELGAPSTVVVLSI
jgi:hypothetical protein